MNPVYGRCVKCGYTKIVFGLEDCWCERCYVNEESEE